MFVYLVEKDSENKSSLKEILVFKLNGKLLELVGHVKIDFIQSFGLIKFDVDKFIYDNKILEREFIDLVFVNIKELYHVHTHHDGDLSTAADRMLPVCILEDMSDVEHKKGKLEIVKQFQKKVIVYHKVIRFFLDVSERQHNKAKTINNVHALIRQAKGEFIYALNFLKFYNKSIDDAEMYEIIFNNAIISIETFSEQANVKYAFASSEGIRKLTWYLVALTLILILTSIYFPLRVEVAIESLSNAIKSRILI